MFSSLLESGSKRCYKIAGSCLLSDLAQWIHSTYANINDAIHVVPLAPTNNNLDSHLLNDCLQRAQLALIIHNVFLKFA